MGLFSKKPKATQTPADPDAPDAPPQPSVRPEKAPKPPKGNKYGVDPTDFLALRSELMDLKARLEASEQAKALVEARLAALDATTTAMATDRPSGDELRGRLEELQAQLGEVAETAAAANANAENAAAKAAVAATVAADATAAAGAPAATADPQLLARIDALAEQVSAASTPDPAIAHRLDALAAKVDAAPDSSRVVQLEARISELAAKAEEAVAPLEAGPDPDTLARLDQLAERVAAVDSFGSQLSQLNARVSAQAEFGAQLTGLRDRIAELQNDTEERRAAALAATGDADLRDRVNAISDRIANHDGLAAQIGQLAERVAANDSSTRAATEQVNAIEQRLGAVSTELANQVSELGRDIDSLAALSTDSAISDELVGSLKASQVRLAAEQARYEIAFRQDLAALAEQVRHAPRT